MANGVKSAKSKKVVKPDGISEREQIAKMSEQSLDQRISTFEAEVTQVLASIFELLAKDSPLAFFDLKKSEIKFSLNKIGNSEISEPTARANLLGSIVYAAPHHPDSERELEKLIGLISIRRMVEEMDEEVYSRSAQKQLSRMGDECSSLADHLSEVAKLPKPSEFKRLNESKIALQSAVSALTFPNESLDQSKLNEAVRRLKAAEEFSTQTRHLAEHLKTCADCAEKDYRSRETHETLRLMTKSPAKVLERESLLSAKWPMKIASLAAVVVFCLLVMAPDSVVTMGIALITAAAAFGVCSLLSFAFGVTARRKDVENVQTVFTGLLHWRFAPIEPTPPAQVYFNTANAPADGIRQKAIYTWFKREFHYNTDARHQIHGIEWSKLVEEPAPFLKENVKTYLDDAHRKTKAQWASIRRRMRGKNLVLLTLGTVSFAWLGHIAADTIVTHPWKRNDKLEIETRRPETTDRFIYQGLIHASSPNELTIMDPRCRKLTRFERSSIISISSTLKKVESDKLEPEAVMKPQWRVYQAIIGLPHAISIFKSKNDEPQPDKCYEITIKQDGSPTRLKFESGLELKQDQSPLLSGIKSATETLLNGLAQIVSAVQQKEVTILYRPELSKTAATCLPPCSLTADKCECAIKQRPLIFLPLFPGPVRTNIPGNRNGGINTPAEAFHFGQNDLSNPVLAQGPTGQKATLIEHIAGGMKACLDSTKRAYEVAGRQVPESKKLKLTVFGFASENKFESIPSTNRFNQEELNLFLAEGRRVAAVREFRKVIGNHPLISIDREPETKAHSLSSLANAHEISAVRSRFQFLSYSMMQDELKNWVHLRGVDSQGMAPGQEALARSVIIRIDNDALQHCGSTA